MTTMPRAAVHRVAMVLPRLDLGGMEQTVLAQAIALRERGLEVHLLVLQDGGLLWEHAVAKGLPIHAGEGITGVRRASAFLASSARRLALTHLHSHTGTWWPAARAAHRLGIPHLHTRHGFVEGYDWRAAVTEWLAARRTDAVICVSDPLRTHTQRTLRVPAARCLLLRNGIDLRALIGPVTRPDLRARSEEPALAMVCRFAPVKNVPLAVRAFAQLRQHWPELTLHLVGDGPERAAILATAEALQVHDGLRLHGASTDPWTHVPSTAIVIQSSDSEGLSLSLIEALAHGHRVVATDVGETRAFCGALSGMRIVPPGDETVMVDAIDAMLRWSAEDTHQAISANRAHAYAHGSLDGVIESVLALYARTQRHR